MWKSSPPLPNLSRLQGTVPPAVDLEDHADAIRTSLYCILTYPTVFLFPAATPHVGVHKVNKRTLKLSQVGWDSYGRRALLTRGQAMEGMCVSTHRAEGPTRLMFLLSFALLRRAQVTPSLRNLALSEKGTAQCSGSISMTCPVCDEITHIVYLASLQHQSLCTIVA